jgi:hypothetical protein
MGTLSGYHRGEAPRLLCYLLGALLRLPPDFSPGCPLGQPPALPCPRPLDLPDPPDLPPERPLLFFDIFITSRSSSRRPGNLMRSGWRLPYGG